MNTLPDASTHVRLGVPGVGVPGVGVDPGVGELAGNVGVVPGTVPSVGTPHILIAAPGTVAVPVIGSASAVPWKPIISAAVASASTARRWCAAIFSFSLGCVAGPDAQRRCPAVLYDAPRPGFDNSSLAHIPRRTKSPA